MSPKWQGLVSFRNNVIRDKISKKGRNKIEGAVPHVRHDPLAQKINKKIFDQIVDLQDAISRSFL